MDIAEAIEWYSSTPAHVVLGAPSAWGPYVDELDAQHGAEDAIDAVAPDWSNAKKLIALAMWWAESRYGVTPDWQFPDGTPSWNAGASTGSGTAGSIEHADHTAAGKPTTYKFAAWKTKEEGFNYWKTHVMERLDPAAQAAAEDGNISGFVEGLYQKCMFSNTCPPACDDGARIAGYVAVLDGAVSHVAKLGDIDRSVVTKGARIGLPMGKCPFHDVNGGAGGGGSGGSSAASEDNSTAWAVAGALGLLFLGYIR